MDEIFMRSMTKKLGQDLVYLSEKVEHQEVTIEELRIKAAMYKSAFFGYHDLYEKLVKQRDENSDALIGEFDGFCYSSRRANAIFRTLEDMVDEGLITESEYNQCTIL